MLNVPAGAQALLSLLGKGFHSKIRVPCCTNTPFRLIPGSQGWQLSKQWLYKKCLIFIPPSSDVTVAFAIHFLFLSEKRKREQGIWEKTLRFGCLKNIGNYIENFGSLEDEH